MKQIWTQDSQLINKEIACLIEKKSKLYCLRKGKKEITKLNAAGITTSEDNKMLIINHPHDPCDGEHNCLLYYHQKNKPLRFFESQRVKRKDKYLGLTLPKEIFEIQRRRYQRVLTPHGASATFSLQRSQRVHHATVADVSVGGAKLNTKIPAPIPKGTVVTPLTLTLFQRFQTGEETQFIIPEATVMWTSIEGENTVKMGLYFSLQEKLHETMTDYVDLRSIEDAPMHP